MVPSATEASRAGDECWEWSVKRLVCLLRTRLPISDWERAFWSAGLRRVAGVDEVGRGAMAGPLVAAAVVFPASEGWALRRLRAALADVRDSKLLSPERRVELLDRIEQTAVAIGVGFVPVAEIDAVGLGPANRIAMERAVFALDIDVDALVIDACVLDLATRKVAPSTATPCRLRSRRPRSSPK